jgi:hypothetical protein
VVGMVLGDLQSATSSAIADPASPSQIVMQRTIERMRTPQETAAEYQPVCP